MKITKGPFFILTACLFCASALFADSDPLLDAVLSSAPVNTPKKISADKKPQPADAALKATIQKPSKEKETKSIQNESEKKFPESFPNEGIENKGTDKSLEKIKFQDENLVKDHSASFERSSFWIGAGKSEAEFDNDKFEMDTGISATLGLSFGLCSRWDLDILGNYRFDKVTRYDEDEDLNHYDVRGLLNYSLVNDTHVRLYLTGGAMYGQSDIPFRDYYKTWRWTWWGWRSRKHWYTDTSRATILGGLIGGGVEIYLNRLLLHANVLELLGGDSDTDYYLDTSCDIGDATLISGDIQYAISESWRVGFYVQSESYGKDSTTIDITTYGGFLGYAF